MRLAPHSLVRSFAPLLLLTLAAVAPAARTTSHLDSVEAEVTNRAAALVPPLDKPQKKLAKAYKTTSKQLAKDVTTRKAELNVLNKVVLTLDKALLPGDDLRDGLPAVVGDYQDDVATDLDDANDTVAALAESKNKTKAAKFVTKGQGFLASADAAEDSKSRIQFVRKAETSLRSVLKFVAKAAGGGGGNGDCGNSLLAAGDSGSFTVDGAPVVANRGGAVFYDDGFTSGVQLRIESCAATGGTKPEVFIQIADPAEQSYFIGFDVSAGQAFVSYRDTEGLAEAVFGDFDKNTVTITEYDAVNGIIAGTFAFADTHTVTAGTFRFVHLQ